MKVNVSLTNNLLPDKYGKYATGDQIKNGKPIISFPVEFSEIPDGTKSLAFTFTDPDSIPVCGFEWIHWTAANIPVSQLSLPENFSHGDSGAVVQGKNSSASPLLNNNDPDLMVGYNGPYPPDQTHDYVLKAYALDTELDIAQGFWMNELLHKMNGHILGQAKMIIPSRA
ncbi:YbhB/YbcL family Raf kinase inhibitor-like protein [Companilactobacillus furfuricola]|uniref:YbhB/YbcL family Raf kinase inhibitor-like protein n=1 Tax=Companilactobacillus furfuricola TaxID=1462575 RepID=UPI000F7B3EE2|nr:YbhB/YbcL family Raf kinase inhibitor-like protein [Companilactobacillus furfuricola]